MLLSYQRSIAIFTPFKNYASSMHQHFRTHPDLQRNWWLTVGPHPGESNVGTHTNVRLTYHPKMRYYVLLRHPYDRVVSMWKFCQKISGPIPFERWFEDHGTKDYTPESPASFVYPYDEIIRVEELEDGLQSLGIPMDNFPHANKGEGSHELTQAEKDRIFEVHRWDFEVGGYEP